ncbi:glycosyltransferase family 2 protein [Pseudoscourfieldia marina]
MPSRLKLAVVIPTLNESSFIASCLESVSEGSRNHVQTVVVVDGGSDDNTPDIVRATPMATHILGTVLENTSPNRGIQLDKGARKCLDMSADKRIDVLLFVHADTILPANYAEHIAEALKDGQMWGAWEAWHPRLENKQKSLDPCIDAVSLFARLRSKHLGVAYGDQCLFMRREAYEAVGGFQHWPLLEDLNMARALKEKFGYPSLIPVEKSVVFTSMRRYRKLGSAPTCLLNNMLVCMWRSGYTTPQGAASIYYGVDRFVDRITNLACDNILVDGIDGIIGGLVSLRNSLLG